MKQTEVTVEVKFEADSELYDRLAKDYNHLTEKVKSSGNSEVIQAFVKFSETFKQFLHALSLKLDDSSTSAAD